MEAFTGFQRNREQAGYMYPSRKQQNHTRLEVQEHDTTTAKQVLKRLLLYSCCSLFRAVKNISPSFAQEQGRLDMVPLHMVCSINAKLGKNVMVGYQSRHKDGE